MTRALAHRGPDGEALFERGPCHLGLRRLAIVDVDAPLPPFTDESKTVFSICNGEINNADELRAELEGRGHRFTTVAVVFAHGHRSYPQITQIAQIVPEKPREIGQSA